MLYPQLRSKIQALDTKYHLNIAAINSELRRDKTTIWRWLREPDRLKQEQQEALVKAVCKTLEIDGLSDQDFRGNNFLMFCKRAGISAFEAAIYSGFSLPVPEVIIEGLFDFTSETHRFIGRYLLFRHDKEPDIPGKPYIQACARIYRDEHQRIKYEDSWGEGAARQTYEGYVFSVGTVINIIGQSKGRTFVARPEIWWCGLQQEAKDTAGDRIVLRGYVSDIARSGTLFADRIALVRVPDDEWERVRKSEEFSFSREQLIRAAGRVIAQYLDAWKSVQI